MVTAVQGMVKPRRRWDFEVVGVRLVPGQVAAGGLGWLAYGTLVWDMPATGVPGVT